MYPISYEADPALEGRNRLTTFFRYIVAIPWMIVAYIYGIVAEIAAIIAWFAIVFTGKYPEGLYNFNAGYLRMSSRTNSFLYLLTDEFPPFGGEEAADYPVRIGVPAPLGEYSRLKTGLRLIIGIPVMLLAIVQAIILYVVSIIAWFAILFTGKLGRGSVQPDALGHGLSRQDVGLLPADHRGLPAVLLRGGWRHAPAGQISSEAASRES